MHVQSTSALYTRQFDVANALNTLFCNARETVFTFTLYTHRDASWETSHSPLLCKMTLLGSLQGQCTMLHILMKNSSTYIGIVNALMMLVYLKSLTTVESRPMIHCPPWAGLNKLWNWECTYVEGVHCPSALFVFPVQMCSNIWKAVTDPYQHLPTFCVKLLTDDIPIFAALRFALLWITMTIVLMVMIWIMKWITMTMVAIK